MKKTEKKTTKKIKVVKKINNKAPKKSKKVYFGIEVQEAIIRYNLSDNDSERNIIYRNEIHAAFDKLCENIINTFKFTYFDYGFEAIKHEVVSFLVMNMHKYDHTKGSKAFSYFSIVAKNYLILHNNSNYKKIKSHSDLKVLEYERNISDKETGRIPDLMRELVLYFDKKIPSLFKRKKDIEVAYAILELIQKRDEIENFNKKALYILIREMTNVETTQITKVANVLRKQYKKILAEYDATGTIASNRENIFF